MTKIINKIFINIVKFYQYIISPLLGNNCRYFPSCSEYFIDCLKTHGPFKGSFKGLMRLLTCHPIKILGGGEGYKPLKDKK
tara:strand:- start:1538 stop:1780 length:243 start_codon:yes stop_codon:yes gene_type:complete